MPEKLRPFGFTDYVISKHKKHSFYHMLLNVDDLLCGSEFSFGTCCMNFDSVGPTQVGDENRKTKTKNFPSRTN